MTKRHKAILAGGAAVAIAAGGAAFAYGVSGDSEEQVSGPSADQARSAALETVGGGTVTSVEREDEGGAGAYEVEVRRSDRSQVEVHLDDQYRSIGTEPDDDTGSESDDDRGEDD